MLIFKQTNVVDYQDWNELVSTTYGKPYNLQQQNGCMSPCNIRITVPDVEFDFDRTEIPDIINGTAMGVSFKSWSSRDLNEWYGDPDDKRFIELFWERNFYPDICMLANDLHERGLILAGDYLIAIEF